MRLAFDTVVYQPKIDSLIPKPLHVNLGIRLDRFHCSPTSTIITKLSSSQNETTLLWSHSHKVDKQDFKGSTASRDATEVTWIILYITVNTIQRKADERLSHTNPTLMLGYSRLLTNYPFETRPHPNTQKKQALIWAAASAKLVTRLPVGGNLVVVFNWFCKPAVSRFNTF